MQGECTMWGSFSCRVWNIINARKVRFVGLTLEAIYATRKIHYVALTLEVIIARRMQHVRQFLLSCMWKGVLSLQWECIVLKMSVVAKRRSLLQGEWTVWECLLFVAGLSAWRLRCVGVFLVVHRTWLLQGEVSRVLYGRQLVQGVCTMRDSVSTFVLEADSTRSMHHERQCLVSTVKEKSFAETSISTIF